MVKSEDKTDPGYGRYVANRDIKEYLKNGIVNIDKPAGPSSHQVAAWVRDILGLKKTGHSGTLDPKVTGVLPIALEDATRIIRALLLSEKEYVCLMTLHGKVPDDKLEKTLNYFQGEIFQTPPIKSAVKRELRIRHIYEIRLLEREGSEVLFAVKCEAGTYIRKLCHDIGLVLGVGAHMKELRRIRTGPFDESSITTLQDLKDAYETYRETGDEKELRKIIQPIETAVKRHRKIWLKDTAVAAIAHGAKLNAPGISKLEDGIERNTQVALMTLKNELVAVATAQLTSQEMLQKTKGVVANPTRVFMEPDKYPRIWKTQRKENI